MGKKHVLAIFIVVLLILSFASAVRSESFEAMVYIKRGQDEVYLDMSVVYKGYTPSTTRSGYRLNIAYNSLYERPSRYSGALKIDQEMEMSIDEYVYVYQPPITRYVLRLNYEIKNGISSMSATGSIDTVNGSISVDIGAKLAIGEVSKLSIFGNIDIDKSLVPRDAVQQVQLALAMLNPYLINYQLAQQGITWLNVSRLRIEFMDVGTDYRLNIAEAELDIDIIGFAVSSGLDLGKTSDMIAMLKEVEERCSVEVLYNMYREDRQLKTVSSTSLVLDVSYGDLEKYYRELQGELNKLYQSLFLSPRYASEASHLLELVLLPSSASAKIEVVIAEGSVYAVADVRNIRLGHQVLRGDEAVKRITAILLSLIELVKRYGPTVNVVSEVEVDYGIVEELVQRNRVLIEGLRTGEALSPSLRTQLFASLGTAIPIRYIITEVPIGYTETYTTTPPLTTPIATPYEPITVYTTTTTITTTALSIVYQTVYRTVTTTLTLTPMTTTVVQKDVSLAVVLLVAGLAVGIALGYFLSRRKQV